MMYKLVRRVIQYFCFPERPIKVGTSWIFRKGGNLRKGGFRSPLKFSSPTNLIFCPQFFWSEIFTPPPPHPS